MSFKKWITICALAGSLALVGCGENFELTEIPISVDIYVDSTYSNDQVDHECMDDVMEAARLAAGSRGYLRFHTFDGDPFHARGMSESFDEVVLPGGVEGTAGETKYLEGKADDLRPKIEELIEEKADIPETPLIHLLERAGRSTVSTEALEHILICTDGLFTDVNPNKMTRDDAASIGASLPSALQDVVVDFIGLDGSEPERGPYIERTRPLVQAMLAGAGTRIGSWELELPNSWRKDLIAAANSGATG